MGVLIGAVIDEHNSSITINIISYITFSYKYNICVVHRYSLLVNIRCDFFFAHKYM